jgi:hypothetical protein
VFGNRKKRDEIIGGWSKLLNEELQNFYSQNTVRMVKSRWIRQAGHVVWRGREKECIQGFGRKI